MIDEIDESNETLEKPLSAISTHSEPSSPFNILMEYESTNYLKESSVQDSKQHHADEARCTAIQLNSTSDIKDRSPSKSMTVKRKSLANTDIESLKICKENEKKIKFLLRNWKEEMVMLRRKCKSQQKKLNRWTKGVKSINSLTKHIKKKKLINEKVEEILKVSGSSKS